MMNCRRLLTDAELFVVRDMFVAGYDDDVIATELGIRVSRLQRIRRSMSLCRQRGRVAAGLTSKSVKRMLRMRDRGMTYREIGDAMNKSHQAVHQLLSRLKTALSKQ